MKFGLFSHLPWPEGTTPSQVIHEATEQLCLAEETGYYSSWFAEHHFSRYGIGSSSLVVLSNLAAQTKTIRLGTAVLVPPLHHPVHLAEDAATLDVVSGGRLDVGFGRGTANYEYTGYNVDPSESQERFQETISIVEGLWTTPDFNYEGKYFNVNQANLVPPPVQEPHPPIYIAATRTFATLQYVVSTGHPLICGVVLNHDDGLDLCNRFVAMSEEAGYYIPISAIPFFRYLHVAETEIEARKNAEPAISWTMDMTDWRRSIRLGSEVNQRLENFRKTRTSVPPTYDYLAEKRAIIGTPEQCITAIREFQQQGIEYFGCNFDFGGMPHETVMRSMKLFAEEVMPHFQ